MDGVGEAGQRPHEGAAGARGPQEGFAGDVTGRPIWRLLLRGLGVYLPGWRTPETVLRVPGGATGFGPPAFLDGDAGFGLQLPDRRKGLEPDREIYVRGRENPSFGIVVAGPAEAIGSRVVDAPVLMRFARRLTFEELFDTGDADSVPYAVRGARAVENVVFLDRAAGVGLCAEVEPVTRALHCPLYVRIGGPAERTVRAYAMNTVPAADTPHDMDPAYGVDAQAVRSHS
ncbi:hypothetical protein [Actinomadura verrucosospora]|nr:hypothetical protein [Actinomadura verrucosospora]